jgi:hypothetical protein
MIANPGSQNRQLGTPQSSSLVFISQASTDRALVSWVCDQVEAMGMRAYVAQQDVRPGVPIELKVREAIAVADVLLAVLTSDGTGSGYVQQEIGAARMAGKPVLALVDRQLGSTSLGLLDGIEQIRFDPEDLAAVSADLTAGLRTLDKGRPAPVSPAFLIGAQPALQLHLGLHVQLTAGQVLVGLIFLVAAFGLASYILLGRLGGTPSAAMATA